ncbi:hypothetical protein [Geodermatophilus sp. CPCC 205761]|uniref:hypothetical protein n=1 Tax=Geodermatophilus sp. CPCC 205761 TaxID=2936597 RepID=UPI003EEF114E
MNRTVAFGALWTASAAAAVGLGLLAVSFVDAGTPLDTQLASATDSQQSGSATSTTPTTPSTPTDSSAPAPAPAPAPTSDEQVTVAGTVYASCDAGGLSLVSAPAAGWWLDDSQDPGEVEFENGSQKLEVTISCVDGRPQFFVEGPRDDSSGRGRGGDDSSGTPVSTAPAGTAPSTGSSGGDDSDGRVGGGHGSDDGPGDDSAGRSDDSDDDSGRGRGRGGDDG